MSDITEAGILQQLPEGEAEVVHGLAGTGPV